MARKVTDGPLRNKERTKQKLIDTVGKLLSEKGYPSLNISNIASEAKVDRQLIYEYFGNLEGLLRSYLEQKDFWKHKEKYLSQIISDSNDDNGKETSLKLLYNLIDSLKEDDEKRKIIHWGISEKNPLLQNLSAEREKLAETLFRSINDDYFKDKPVNYRAIQAILVSSIYFLSMHLKENRDSFCTFDLNSEEGMNEIKKAMKQIIDFAYDS